MGAKVIDGKRIAATIRQQLAKQVSVLVEAGQRPGLAVVLVGENPASQVYVRMKRRACEEVGIYSAEYRLPETTSQEELLDLIHQLNQEPTIHGILVQLPLPEGIDELAVLMNISPEKDVDGFHPINAGKLSIGEDSYLPCTPAGVIELIKSVLPDMSGKQAVVVGRSNIVGKPVALLLLRQHATVTICHSRTKDLAHVCRNADILVAAVGRAEVIKEDWIKPGAIVIDVGINRTDAGLVGDVDYQGASKVAGALTPVPGGVGPMTIAMLLKNTVEAAQKSR